MIEVETSVEVGYGNVFEKTLDAYESGKEVIIHRGGTGSGKTEDIMIFLLFDIAMQERDKVITVVSESHPHLEIGAIRILKKHLISSGHWTDKCFNGSIGRYTSPTNSIIEFFSADRIGKALGARRDWLYGNEINSLKVEIWDELARRSKYIIADFNPTAEFWLEEWLLDYLNTIVIKSNYLDNPFLPEHEILRIKQKAGRNENFKRVHIDCEYGVSEGVVFDNWSVGDFDDTLNLQCFGQDYGFSIDPTTLIHVGVDKAKKKLYIDEYFALPGLSTAKIAELNKVHAGDNLIIGDGAEARLIDELKKEHKINIQAAEKGPGSITAGITSMQDYEIIVTNRSVNTKKELRSYVYLDKGAKVYIDDYNHCIDASRYAYTFLTKNKVENFQSY